MKVYIVFGTTGEYSDRQEWPVCGYKERARADKHADEAMIWAHLLKEKLEEENKNHWDVPRDASPYDKSFYMDYTGTDYYVLEVEMADE